MTSKISLNPFNQNQRKFFQFGIVFLMAILFFILYLIFRHSNQQSNLASGVVLSDSKLQVFNDTYEKFNYPDRINVHHPYLLVIQPERTLTTVYDLEKKEKVKDSKQVLLDYDGENILINGKDTFFNNTDLGVLCSNAFISSDKEILCAVPNSESEVLSINPETKAQKVIYKTNNLVTTVSVIQGKIYVGEMDTQTNKDYLVVDGERIELPTPVSLVYPMKDKIYAASFKSVFTGNRNIYYLVLTNKVGQLSSNKIELGN